MPHEQDQPPEIQALRTDRWIQPYFAGIEGIPAWQRDLVGSILPNFRFARSAYYSIILLHLLKYTVERPRDDKSRSDTQISNTLQEALGSSHNMQGTVRAAIGELRKKLNEYFENEGDFHKHKIEISNDGDRLIKFLPRSDERIRQFWRDHGIDEVYQRRPVLITYTEPLFFRRPDSEVFVRHRLINEPLWKRASEYAAESREARDRIGELLPQILADEMTPSHHYMGSGDTRCMVALTRIFERRYIPTNHEPAHSLPTWHDTRRHGESIICIGNTRTHHFIRDCCDMNMLKFQPEEHGFINLAAEHDEPQSYEDELQVSNTKRIRIVYGTIARLRLPFLNNRVLTAIISNEGPAFEEIGRTLTDNVLLANVLQRAFQIEDPAEPLPHSFELLFRVAIDAEDQSVDNAQYVARRVPGDNTAAPNLG